ncbi:hypothetical protein D3C76_1288560 [compost metagenome]
MVGMRCYFQWHGGVIDVIVELDETQPRFGKLLGDFTADALDGVPVVGAQGPVDINLGDTQRVFLVQQRDTTLHVGELLEHRADDAVPWATELGNEFNFAGDAHFTGEVFKKVFDLGGSPVSAHIR